jgi:hypothetical protein
VDGEEDVEHRPEPQEAPRGEPAAVEGAGARPLLEDELAHEEAAQDEEEVDAGPAEGVSGPLEHVDDRVAAGLAAEVPAQRQHDRDAADDVEIESPGGRAGAVLRSLGRQGQRGNRGRH